MPIHDRPKRRMTRRLQTHGSDMPTARHGQLFTDAPANVDPQYARRVPVSEMETRLEVERSAEVVRKAKCQQPARGSRWQEHVASQPTVPDKMRPSPDLELPAYLAMADVGRDD
ncbi:MAG: hypothetical protein KJO07_15470 [Deltaproteobacteria bacterium]|nr:hypothetical protein [Deltaproteobacteria bacterium]